MPTFKYASEFVRMNGPAFDTLHKPGDRVPLSGIYKCTGCGDEVCCNKGDPLPPQNRHQHTSAFIPIRWRLVTASVQLRTMVGVRRPVASVAKIPRSFAR